MKKLCIVSEDSIIAGFARSGIAEVSDSLAVSLTDEYEVSVICIDGNSSYVKLANSVEDVEDGIRLCRLFKVNFFLVDSNRYEQLMHKLLISIRPDIVHVFADLAYTDSIISPEFTATRSIYTIDDARYVDGKEHNLLKYDYVTTVSEGYAAELLSRSDELSSILNEVPFKGVTNGILSQAFAPEKGLLIGTKYTSESLANKSICKKRIAAMYGTKLDKAIFLMMCRLVPAKGVDLVLGAVSQIADSGGFVIIVGRGNEEIENSLGELKPSKGGIWVPRWPSPIQAIPILAGADFYFNPSYSEACGLMPMTATRFGVIPITTLVGGLQDNMKENFAITLPEPSGECMEQAVRRAFSIYNNPPLFDYYRSTCMKQDFSWNTRKMPYIDLYEM